MIQTSNELLLSNHETARVHQKSSEIKRKSPYPKPIPMTPPICPQHFSFLTRGQAGISSLGIPKVAPNLVRLNQGQVWWRDVSKLAKALVVAKKNSSKSAKSLVVAKKHQEAHDGHISWEKPIQNHVYPAYICLKHPKNMFLKQFKNAVVSPELLIKFFELTISAKVSVQSFRSQINPWITHPGES